MLPNVKNGFPDDAGGLLVFAEKLNPPLDDGPCCEDVEPNVNIAGVVAVASPKAGVVVFPKAGVLDAKSDGVALFDGAPNVGIGFTTGVCADESNPADFVSCFGTPKIKGGIVSCIAVSFAPAVFNFCADDSAPKSVFFGLVFDELGLDVLQQGHVSTFAAFRSKQPEHSHDPSAGLNFSIKSEL